MRAIGLWIAAATAAAALAGSASGASGLKRHVVRGEGLSLAVPTSWVALDRRIPRAVIDRLSRENPRLKPFIDPLTLPSSPMKFLAVDPVARGGFTTNVNVVVTPAPAGMSFSQYRRSLIAGLGGFVQGARIEYSTATIGGVRAVRLRYRFQLRAGKPLTVQTLQYGFLRGRRSVVVTYTTLPRLEARYAATFRRSAASVRFTR